MHFSLLDSVLQPPSRPDPATPVGASITTLKQVTAAEEYLRDHFADFPVLPGVLMVESLVQAGRLLLSSILPATPGDPRLVLGSIRAVKYGRFVRPGEGLRIRVTVTKDLGDGSYELKGEATLLRHPPPAAAATHPTHTSTAHAAPNGDSPLPHAESTTAVSGRFTLRPIRTAPAP